MESPPSVASSASSRSRRHVFFFFVVGVTAALLVVGLLWRLQQGKSAAARSPVLAARLELAAGPVLVTAGETMPTSALPGTPLRAGARIAAGEGARALVRTGDGTGLFLRAGSDLVLEEKGVRLDRGELWVEAPKLDGEAILLHLGPHVVSAADAGLSVRREGDTTVVYVARGLVVLTSPSGRVEVNAGQQATARATGAPQVVPVAYWQDWTGGMADAHALGTLGSGSGSLYGIEPNALPGTPTRKLGVAKQAVRAILRDGLAETEVDQTFANPGGNAIEGWYWFSLPADASVTSFALETNGVLVEGEVVEKKEAAARYEAAKRAAADPALLEWVDGRSYRARIFPIPPNGARRVVLRYLQTLPAVEGVTRYVYPLRSPEPARLDEFSLSVDLGDNGRDHELAASPDALVEEGGRRVALRRSGYTPRADFQLEIRRKTPVAPVRAWRFATDPEQADYLLLRYVPDIDFAKLPPVHGHVAVVLDTSAGGEESARNLRTSVVEAVLRALSPEDRFTVLSLDVKPTVLYPNEGLAAASEGEVAKALEQVSKHGIGGASDLGAMFEPALERLHGAEQPVVLYVGDGVATSGESGPDALLERLRRSLSGSRARFFAVGVGNGVRHELLEQLALVGGGRYLRVRDAEEVTAQALALTSALKTPTVTDLDIDLGAGLDEPLLSATGKLARGEELTLLARTHHQLPANVHVKGRAGGQDFHREIPLRLEGGITTSLVPRLWASEYVRRLLGSGPQPEDNRSKVLSLGLEYGLVTPFTSILALDSDAAYAQQGLPRKTSKLRGVRLTELTSPEEENRLALQFAPALFSQTTGCNSSGAPASRATTGEETASYDNHSSKRGEAPPAEPPPQTVGNAFGSAAESSPAPSVNGNKAGGLSNEKDEGSIAALERSVGSDQGTTRQRIRGACAPGDPLCTDDRPSAGAVAPSKAKPAAPTTLPLGPLGPIKGGGGGGVPSPPKEAKKPAPLPPTPPGVKPEPSPSKPALAGITVAAFVDRRLGLAVCSDASSRPLAERIYLWQRRLHQTTAPADLVRQYDLARAACELPDWRDQAALLHLIQLKIRTEEAVEVVLTRFRNEPDAQRFVAFSVLRRTVDPRLEAAVTRVLFGGRVDWFKVDREILDAPKPEDKLKKLRQAMLVAPGDPNGDARLIRLLALNQNRAEAVAHGRRLRDRGLMTPRLAQQLGDVLSDDGAAEEALRTYSEIVEFDPDNAASRQVLGDVFLRHGWYDAAYRQYKALTTLNEKNAVAWLRLAAAAAGAGRVDEALRLERQVASSEGTSGPSDPRVWARDASAARLGIMLVDPAKVGATAEAIGRKLKELQLFSGPATLALLVWEDLDARLELVTANDKKETLSGEITDAGDTGLFAWVASPGAWTATSKAVRWKSDPRGRAVPYRVVVLDWDGTNFRATVVPGELKGDGRQVAL